MPVRRSVTVSLSPELLTFAGRYGNANEVGRTALRQLEERELEFLSHRERQQHGPERQER